MTLKKELSTIEHGYHIELWQTYKLTEETYNQVSQKLEKASVREKFAKLDEEEKARFQSEIEAYASKSKKPEELSELAKALVFSTGNDFWLEKRLANLTNMALIYIVTLLEAFVKEYLTYLYSKKPVLLKSSKTITYEEILSLDRMPKVYSLLAEKEVEQISYKSIDQLADYLNAKFKLGINDDMKWWGLCR